jgi:hypothetical protein
VIIHQMTPPQQISFLVLDFRFIMISLFLMRKLGRSIGWRHVPFLLLTYMS